MNKNRRPIIAIDFDGTIVRHEYPEVGKLLPDAAKTIRWLHDWADIIIWTCRYTTEDIEQMKLFLSYENIPYDSINANMPSILFRPIPKIYFDIGIDDRNIGGLPSWNEIRNILEKEKCKWTEEG